MIVFGVWTIIAGYYASKLSPISKEENFLKEDHPLMQEQNDSFRDFGLMEFFKMDVSIYWGVKNIDKSDTSRWDSHNIGKVILDDDFSLYSVAA